MVTLQSRVHVDEATAHEMFEFLVNPTDAAYQAWWPGTHLAFHVVRRGEDGHVGDVVWMDEWVGRRRLRMSAVVEEVVPGRRIVWRLRRGIALPARLVLELDDDGGGGLEVTHTVRAGGGRLLDALVRRWLTPRMARDLDEHARTEFPRLGALLARGRAGSATTASTPAV